MGILGHVRLVVDSAPPAARLGALHLVARACIRAGASVEALEAIVQEAARVEGDTFVQNPAASYTAPELEAPPSGEPLHRALGVRA